MELKPIEDYIQPGGQVNFHTIIASALRKGETAIGYRLVSEASQAEQSFGVHINPEKSKLIPFSDLDQVIVLANAG
jgi:ion channel POLLUX/CASTOR